MTALQNQLKTTAQLLADRKVLERAKGRLQQPR
jgi:AmiR/NasT family two-component response regulator